MKRIAILGSTGSIGRSALDVIRRLKDKFRVAALSTNSDVATLYQQVKEFRPKLVCVKDVKASRALRVKLNSRTKVFNQDAGLEHMLQDISIDKVLLAISGSSALRPLLAAIENKKEIALANKEALVMAGPIIMQRARLKKVKILPIDSEQSAIWQCLDKEAKDKLKRIYLTASGGPFLKATAREFKNVTLSKVLKHPKWKMGKKITVDSATLMNKGLELLEAMFLFGVESGKIKVLIHPEAVIHSMVEFMDGVVLAQLSITDMRIPIQYALSYPERLSTPFAGIDFLRQKALHFLEPDFSKFPCLGLAYSAAQDLGTCPAVLNAANEVSVEAFLKNRIGFLAIPEVIERVLKRHKNNKTPSLSDILEADAWAREEANRCLPF